MLSFKKRKKAFTLIELLAVIFVVGIISIIVIPTTNRLINQSRNNLYENQIDNIMTAAKNWGSKNNDLLPEKEKEILTVTLGQLKVTGFIDKQIKNPKTKRLFPDDMEVVITRKNNNYEYKIIEGSGNDDARIDWDAPLIFINGSAHERVEINTPYIEKGVLVRGPNGEEITNYDIKITLNDKEVEEIDTSKLVQYKITYTASFNDVVANAVRMVSIVDTIPPELTIPGNTKLTSDEVASFDFMEGVSATDNSLENIKVTISGNISVVPGEYTLIYEAKDSSGNKTTLPRVITIIDNIPPTVSFDPVGAKTYKKSHSTKVTVRDEHSGVEPSSLKYFWSTVTKTPAETEFKTNFNNNANFKTPNNVSGEYYLWIRAKDKSGNLALKRSDAFKLDNTPPVLKLNGSSNMTVNAGSTYNEPGATATDNVDGNITNKIKITGIVNVNILGTYTINYEVSDNAGNKATATRKITVIDKTPPTITFSPNGNSTYKQNHSTKINVTDQHSGVNTSSLRYLWRTTTSTPSESLFTLRFSNNETINTIRGVSGNYYLWILAKDNDGNTAITRSNVFKVDDVSPIIIPRGSLYMTIPYNTSFTDPGATATDDIDGDITSKIKTTGSVNTRVLGTHRITYNVSDNTGNKAVAVTRTINVVDVEAPVITVKGSNPATVYVGNSYRDAGATAIDDVDGDVTSQMTTTGSVNTNRPGAYTITYSVKDNAGNRATATRRVNVVDNIPPTVSFSPTGNSTYNKSYNVRVSVSDEHSIVSPSSLKYLWKTNTTTPTESNFSSSFVNNISISSPTNVSGGYYLWILAKDSAGNRTITRSNVFRLDNVAPVITIKGSNPVNIDIGDTYRDAGATATDNIDGTVSVSTSNNVNTNRAGTYTVTYTAKDSAGNTSKTTRTVKVNSLTQYRYRDEYSYTDCDTCYDTCEDSTPATRNYSCPSGWSRSGSRCTRSYSVYSTFYRDYVCTSGTWHYKGQTCSGNCNAPCSDGSSANGSETSNNCPSGRSCGSQGAVTSCTANWRGSCSESQSADVSYSCSSGWYRRGTTCYRDYSCNPYDCRCSTEYYWGSWSSWSFNYVRETSTRQVQTRNCTSWPCST